MPYIQSMKKLFSGVALAGFLALGGCANMPVPLQPVQQLTQKDVQNALLIAQQNNDTEGVQCFTYLNKMITPNPNAPAPVVPTGVLSAFEAAHVAGHALIVGGLNPQARQALEMACGPYVLNVEGDLTALGTAVGARIALPGLAVGG